MARPRAQVVRDAVACAFYFAHQSGDFVDHAVHEKREHVEFVAPGNGEPHRKVAARDAAGGALDQHNAPDVPDAEQEFGARAAAEAQEATAEQRLPQFIVNVTHVEARAVGPNLTHGAQGRRRVIFLLPRDAHLSIRQCVRTRGRRRRAGSADEPSVIPASPIRRGHPLILEPAFPRVRAFLFGCGFI